MANAWSEQEVKATIKSYFAMLELELQEKKYNKASFRKALLAELDNRTEGSIEFKHQNISGVLADLDREFIKGYKPMRNYQKSLKIEIIKYLEIPN